MPFYPLSPLRNYFESLSPHVLLAKAEHAGYNYIRSGRKSFHVKAEGPLDKRSIIYYTSENEEFSTAVIEPRRIGSDYPYLHSSAWKKFTRFFWYRIVAMPIAYLYVKLKFRHKIIGAEAMKPYRGRGIFLYGNHTQDIGDAFIPNMIEKRHGKYVIVHPNNVSIPIVGRVAPSLGAIPLPDELAAMRGFVAAIDKRIAEGNAVVIYPEAHIWPYYTKIRDFPDASFSYPVKHSAPCFCFTNTYHKKGSRREPQIVTYVDGPFFPDEKLPPRDRRRELRDRIHAAMTERAKNSDYVTVEYVRKEAPND